MARQIPLLLNPHPEYSRAAAAAVGLHETDINLNSRLNTRNVFDPTTTKHKHDSVYGVNAREPDGQLSRELDLPVGANVLRRHEAEKL